MALVGSLAACGSATTSAEPPRGSLPATPTAAATPTETRCGEVVIQQGEQPDLAGGTERDCLENALRQGRSASLTVTAPTTEGDPVVTTWHLSADGVLDALVDTSRDRYAGSSPTARLSCGRVTQIPMPLDCPPLD